MTRVKYANKGKLTYLNNILNKGDYLLFSPKNLNNSFFDSSFSTLNAINLSIISINTKRLNLSLKNTPNEFFNKAIKSSCFICVPKTSTLSLSNVIFLVDRTQFAFTFIGAKINNSFLSPAALELAQSELGNKTVKTLICQTTAEILHSILFFSNNESKKNFKQEKFLI